MPVWRIIGTQRDFIDADILVANFLALIALESGLISDLEICERGTDNGEWTQSVLTDLHETS